MICTKDIIYLDYAATTPVDDRVAAVMCECMTRDGVFANPASRSHQLGRDAQVDGHEQVGRGFCL